MLQLYVPMDGTLQFSYVLLSLVVEIWRPCCTLSIIESFHRTPTVGSYALFLVCLFPLSNCAVLLLLLFAFIALKSDVGTELLDCEQKTSFFVADCHNSFHVQCEWIRIFEFQSWSCQLKHLGIYRFVNTKSFYWLSDPPTQSIVVREYEFLHWCRCFDRRWSSGCCGSTGGNYCITTTICIGN